MMSEGSFCGGLLGIWHIGLEYLKAQRIPKPPSMGIAGVEIM